MSEYTAEVDAVGTVRLLDAIRTCGLERSVKFYHASTSELYGRVAQVPQNEKTPFYPRSPYGEILFRYRFRPECFYLRRCDLVVDSFVERGLIRGFSTFQRAPSYTASGSS